MSVAIELRLIPGCDIKGLTSSHLSRTVVLQPSEGNFAGLAVRASGLLLAG